MFNGLPNEMLYTAYRITTQFNLRDTSARLTKNGTAFFVLNDAGACCLITNRHLLDAGYNEPAGKHVGASISSVLVQGFIAVEDDITRLPIPGVEMEIVSPDSCTTFASNYFEDVACLSNPQVRARNGGSNKVHFHLKTSDFADDAWIESQLSISDFVGFPGFPQWHDKFEMRPILRTGSISSDPRANYSDQPTSKGRRVAYEAFSSGGSSGSPVYATQKGFKSGPGVTVTGYREGKFVGINAGHLAGDFGSHSGVSYFIKSSAIIDLVNVGAPASA